MAEMILKEKKRATMYTLFDYYEDKGREEGRKAGRAEGERIGQIEGEKKGREDERNSLLLAVREMIKDGLLSAREAAARFHLSEQEINSI